QERGDWGHPAGDARAAPGRPRRRRPGGQAGGAGRHERPDGRRPRREGSDRGAGRPRQQAVNLSEPFIRRPVMTAVLTASVVLFGVLSYRQLPVNDLPVVDYPVIQVQADYPGASPDTMANNIATPPERQFSQITGLQVVTSKRQPDHDSLTV